MFRPVFLIWINLTWLAYSQDSQVCSLDIADQPISAMGSFDRLFQQVIQEIKKKKSVGSTTLSKSEIDTFISETIHKLESQPQTAKRDTDLAAFASFKKYLTSMKINFLPNSKITYEFKFSSGFKIDVYDEKNKVSLPIKIGFDDKNNPKDGLISVKGTGFYIDKSGEQKDTSISEQIKNISEKIRGKITSAGRNDLNSKSGSNCPECFASDERLSESIAKSVVERDIPLLQLNFSNYNDIRVSNPDAYKKENDIAGKKIDSMAFPGIQTINFFALKMREGCYKAASTVDVEVEVDGLVGGLLGSFTQAVTSKDEAAFISEAPLDNTKIKAQDLSPKDSGAPIKDGNKQGQGQGQSEL